MRRIAPLAFAALCACGNPDNLVVGSYPLDPSTTIALPEVRSAIFGTAAVTVSAGQTQPMQVIIVSNASDLCTKLTAHPDYFHQNTEPSVSFVMWVVPDRIGDFMVGTTGTGSEIVLGTSGVDAGTPSPTRAFPAIIGDISIGQQDSQLQGGFDVAYLMPNGAGPEFVGRFKANPCTFPASIQLP
jgi:hypothetical protein